MPERFQLARKQAEAYESSSRTIVDGSARLLAEAAMIRAGYVVLDLACGTGLVARHAVSLVAPNAGWSVPISTPPCWRSHASVPVATSSGWSHGGIVCRSTTTRSLTDLSVGVPVLSRTRGGDVRGPP